ncbi:MAG: bifunctional DNA-formamidopyrimidine glycosylase/DNA-(apurinic or apyrimidinic site) lyase [Gammaproteobacteria bacterium]|nr:bifunctional DNA-formamidopyrimidine glycosylase/DNA-(apurinic or apyrimidinic site) lyase [Gammaproteobacteria bacterium]
MPELPEVETTLRGIAPFIKDQKIKQVIIRDHRLRWPIPRHLDKSLSGNTFIDIQRRAKYLLLQTSSGTLIIHLGMSGNLRILPKTEAPIKHDHFEIIFENNKCLRFHDPRRFGCVLWTKTDPMKHKLLSTLGIEPLESLLTGEYLHKHSRNRKIAIKPFLMNSKIVVGVGNIYASEALFLAKIHPLVMANKISLQRYNLLVEKIKNVLHSAIEQGGTTLRDFVSSEGKPGYFQQKLNVYGREGEACVTCKKTIKQIRQGQRSTYYCSKCQK